MDVLTRPECTAPAGQGGGLTRLPLACPKKLAEMAKGASECAEGGGSCRLASDGYYIVSAGSLLVGVVLGGWYLRSVQRLMAEPLASWRAAGSAGEPTLEAGQELRDARKAD
jgi:PAT family acetyl-CoA transporter-like MFS transporter 1